MDGLLTAIFAEYGLTGALTIASIFLLWPMMKDLRSGKTYGTLAERLHKVEVDVAVLMERTK